MKALQLSDVEFTEAIKPNGFLDVALSRGLDPAVVIDSYNQCTIIAVDTEMMALLVELKVLQSDDL